jgi:class 3 adenylate cyclase
MSAALLERAQVAMGRGDLFDAYDAANAAIEGGSDDLRFKYIEVLALVRLGDLLQAGKRYQKYNLGASEDVDVASLGARLLKDAALSRSPSDPKALLEASDAYGAIYTRTGDTFPGVNAATLAMLGGAQDRAEAIALELLAKLNAPKGYFAWATKAEALLVCKRVGEACKEIAIAASLPDADLGARATTYRQFILLANHLALAKSARAELLARIKPPTVFVYCGHMISERNAAAEEALAIAVGAALDEEGAAIAYGALANGADIIIAEELLKRRGELNVVLPFHSDDFIEQSVDPGGPAWGARYQACLRGAQSVTMATDIAYLGDIAQFAYGSLICMGLARLRAQYLGSDVMQLAVWDGVPAEKDAKAGTAVDVSNWQRTNGRVRVIRPAWRDAKQKRPRPPASSARKSRKAPKSADEVTRELRAMIFTDFQGFTELQEAAHPIFWEQVMRRMMDVLGGYGDDICYRNTWGDALYAVVSTTKAAAAITLDLQDSLNDVDYAALGISAEPHLRIGAHYGPVYRVTDHRSGSLNYYGTQVSRTARIEPITPPGAVYVTEQFAAVLAMEAPDAFVCRYVGPLKLAKGYGSSRMYLLKRRH